MLKALAALRLVVMAVGIIGVTVTELAAIVITVNYLMDKGWGLILAVVIVLSVIGSVITALYAALIDGFWWPAMLGIAGVPFIWITSIAANLETRAA